MEKLSAPSKTTGEYKSRELCVASESDELLEDETANSATKGQNREDNQERPDEDNQSPIVDLEKPKFPHNNKDTANKTQTSKEGAKRATDASGFESTHYLYDHRQAPDPRKPEKKKNEDATKGRPSFSGVSTPKKTFDTRSKNNKNKEHKYNSRHYQDIDADDPRYTFHREQERERSTRNGQPYIRFERERPDRERSEREKWERERERQGWIERERERSSRLERERERDHSPTYKPPKLGKARAKPSKADIERPGYHDYEDADPYPQRREKEHDREMLERDRERREWERERERDYKYQEDGYNRPPYYSEREWEIERRERDKREMKRRETYQDEGKRDAKYRDRERERDYPPHDPYHHNFKYRERDREYPDDGNKPHVYVEREKERRDRDREDRDREDRERYPTGEHRPLRSMADREREREWERERGRERERDRARARMRDYPEDGYKQPKYAERERLPREKGDFSPRSYEDSYMKSTHYPDRESEDPYYDYRERPRDHDKTKKYKERVEPRTLAGPTTGLPVHSSSIIRKKSKASLNDDDSYEISTNGRKKSIPGSYEESNQPSRKKSVGGYEDIPHPDDTGYRSPHTHAFNDRDRDSFGDSKARLGLSSPKKPVRKQEIDTRSSFQLSNGHARAGYPEEG